MRGRIVVRLVLIPEEEICLVLQPWDLYRSSERPPPRRRSSSASVLADRRRRMASRPMQSCRTCRRCRRCRGSGSPPVVAERGQLRERRSRPLFTLPLTSKPSAASADEIVAEVALAASGGAFSVLRGRSRCRRCLLCRHCPGGRSGYAVARRRPGLADASLGRLCSLSAAAPSAISSNGITVSTEDRRRPAAQQQRRPPAPAGRSRAL